VTHAGREDRTPVRGATVKILGTEYRLRSDADAEHLQQVADCVDRAMREAQRSAPDTQSAAILAALNIASDHLRAGAGVAIPAARLRALLRLIESAEDPSP
jgi:cell division protein ZapA (FtsZ GTPase activity inhibitor)